jgi:hypothetical protein
VALSVGILCAAGCGQERSSQATPRQTEVVEPMASAGAARARAAASKRPAAEPNDPEVTLWVVGDRRCRARHCRTAPTVKRLRKMLPGLRVKSVDWSAEATKRLLEKEGIERLPAYLFSASVKNHPRYGRLRRFVRPSPKGERLRLKVRARHDPRAELCANGKDDTGNGMTDCADPGCKGATVCRPEKPRRLELFVMSQCPYGIRALDAMSELLEAFEGQLDFRVHFIASTKGDGFRSLHGQAEVRENIRELCAMKHYPKKYKYMDYIYCRNRDIKSANWKACTGKKTGIDARVLAACAEGPEGKKLLREDLQLAQALEIRSSPTWLANNRFTFHGIAPETIKRQFCEHNPKLAGCKKKLSSRSPVPDGVCR